MYVSKTLSLDAKDVFTIQYLIENGSADNASDFVQKAIKYYIKLLEARNEKSPTKIERKSG